jgi:hypothetical protein
MSTVINESQCGHKASDWVWDDFHSLSQFLEKGVWLCAWATADGESGGPQQVFSKQLSYL